MSPTRLLLGQIFIVFLIVILGVWGATQYCASALGYQPELGPAWFTLFDTPVYKPWALFPWWYHFEAYAPEIFDTAGTIAAASGFLRSEEHTSELQSLMRISYAVFCLKQKK